MSIGTKIIGVGSYLPETLVTNEMLEQIVDTSDAWITKRTGIKERRVVKDETTTSMAIAAAKDALKNANIDANDIDIIIGSTVTQDMATPSVASLVQREIGCKQAAAMDIAAGCTGFVYALTVATSLMEILNKETVLIVASENLTSRADWTDRGTCILFGDGAGAVIVKRSKKSYIKHPILCAIPDTDDVLYMGNKKLNNPWSEDLETSDVTLKMKGKEVFAFAVDAVEKTLNELSELSDKPITKIIPHQANRRIIRFVAHNSNFDIEQFYVNVDKLANTSSASIPLAIHQAMKDDWLKKGDVVALVGFGAGLTYGGIIVEWCI